MLRLSEAPFPSLPLAGILLSEVCKSYMISDSEGHPGFGALTPSVSRNKLLSLGRCGQAGPVPLLLPSCLGLSSLLLPTDPDLCSIFLAQPCYRKPHGRCMAYTKCPHCRVEHSQDSQSPEVPPAQLSRMNSGAIQDEVLVQIPQWHGQ